MNPDALLIALDWRSLDRVSWNATPCPRCGTLVAETGFVTLDSGGTECDLLVASSQLVERDPRDGVSLRVHRCGDGRGGRE